MGARSATSAVVLDAGALIAIEKGDRKVLVLCRVATLDHAAMVVPAGVVARDELRAKHRPPAEPSGRGSAEPRCPSSPPEDMSDQDSCQKSEHATTVAPGADGVRGLARLSRA